MDRETKHEYLKMNNEAITDSLKVLIEYSEQTKYKSYVTNKSEENQLEIYSHKIFIEIEQIIENFDKNEQNFSECIERLGKSLREDFDQETPVKNLQDNQQYVNNSLVERDELNGRIIVESQKNYKNQILNGLQQDIQTEDHELKFQLIQSLKNQIDQGFKIMPVPYLPKLDSQRFSYTLVLDLDETLLHFEELNENEGQLSIRPGADSFLNLMSNHFEIVIFTAGTEEYADWALSFLENVSFINHRLYRQHALPFKGYYLKDLSRLGRDLNKTIIVDNIAENFALQPQNGILIKTWISDAKDTSLFELAPLLLKISESKSKDVKEILQLYHRENEELMNSIAFGNTSPCVTNQLTNLQILESKGVFKTDKKEENSSDFNLPKQQFSPNSSKAIDDISSSSSTHQKSLRYYNNQVHEPISVTPKDYQKFKDNFVLNEEAENSKNNQCYNINQNMKQENSYESEQIEIDFEIDQQHKYYNQRMNKNVDIYTIQESMNEDGSQLDNLKASVFKNGSLERRHLINMNSTTQEKQKIQQSKEKSSQPSLNSVNNRKELQNLYQYPNSAINLKRNKQLEQSKIDSLEKQDPRIIQSEGQQTNQVGSPYYSDKISKINSTTQNSLNKAQSNFEMNPIVFYINDQETLKTNQLQQY